MDCSTLDSSVFRCLLEFSNSCPLSWCCSLIIPSSAAPSSLCCKSFNICIKHLHQTFPPVFVPGESPGQRRTSVESQSWTKLGGCSCTRFLTAFLPGSMLLLISWLQSPSIVILEPKKIKFVIASTFSPSVCHKVMGPDALILVCF